MPRAKPGDMHEFGALRERGYDEASRESLVNSRG